MAKPKARGKAPQPAPRKGSRPAAAQLPSDDELDAFQKQRDKISLDASDDAMSEDGLDEEAVYDLSGDESEDFDSDDEGDIEAAIAKGGDLGESEPPMRRSVRPHWPPARRGGMLAARRSCSTSGAGPGPAIAPVSPRCLPCGISPAPAAAQALPPERPA